MHVNDFVARPVPDGFVVHTESTTSILFASPSTSSKSSEPTSASGPAPVFLNPVQEYNRDLSVVAIRSWSEIRQREKRAVWEESLKRRREKKRGKEAATKGEEEEGKGKKRKAEDGKAVEGESKEAEKKEVKEESEPAVKVEEVSPRASYFLSELADEIQECSRNTKSRLTNRQSTNLLFLKLFQRLDSEQSDTRKRSHYSGKLHKLFHSLAIADLSRWQTRRRKRSLRFCRRRYPKKHRLQWILSQRSQSITRDR